MPWIDKRVQDGEEPQPIVHDDGGTGLFDACVARFGTRGWTIVCDAQHTVWVRDPVTSFAVGLSRWALDRQSLSDVLARAEAKITKASTKAKA